MDVTVAESGISLALQLGPLLSKVDEREEVVTDTHTQMYHDLCQMWIPAYEGLVAPVTALPVFGDPIPENRDAKFNEIMTIWGATPPIVDLAWVQKELSKLGYDFEPEALTALLNETQARARATDPFASRMDPEEELNA